MKKHTGSGVIPLVKKEDVDTDDDGDEVVYEEYEMLEEVEQYVNVI